MVTWSVGICCLVLMMETIGCSDLNSTKSFTVLLGTLTNKLYFVYNPREPVTLQTEHGFLVKAGNDEVCQL